MQKKNPSTATIIARDKTRLLFICLGNICRSPAAHAVMQHQIDEKGLTELFEIDSAGIGNWHVGQLPDQRMRRHGAARGYRIDHHARQFKAEKDFDAFDYIITMDKENYRAITAMARSDEDKSKVVRMTEFISRHPEATSVPDPYYGGAADFNLALDLIEDGCEGILRHLTRKLRPRLIIFDFDGTLGDSRKLITDTMMAVINQRHLPTRSREECSKTIGLPLAECFSSILPISNEEAEQCALAYREIFFRNNVPGTVPMFPHVRETLRALHEAGITLTIASSRGHASLQGFVAEMQLSPYIGYILGADDVEEAKPSAVPVLKTLDELHFLPEETLVVGDMHYDILMGKRAGCRTCGVTYGNGTPDELTQAGADFIIADLALLTTICML